ncbi:ATP-binding protein [Desulfatitalea alkaliphila]|uniref:histidine kinase n=1 Tax=Desulfatitalea alkaliphila TaxID=2929485 RepID=A0AA41R3J2_9BACT|nr:ATP-binding protein [Desulfatitalea alkaliphila]MCJ8500365.1 ATP-binding protein [Desulfatitalea alkaliphila]
MANVLIVEDSQPTATAQAYCLWESGHTVAFAGDGATAVAKFGSETFDVVLLDYDLPDTTGLELYRKLRSIDPDVSAVMVTGRGDERLAAKILKEGAKDYLTKSGGLLEMLPDVVQRVLAERETQRRLAAQEEALRQAHQALEHKVAQRTAELRRINQRLEQEIDYRRRVETALLQSNQDMLTLLESVSDGFVAVDMHGRITYINRAAGEWLALAHDDAIDKKFGDAFPWAADAGLDTTIKNVSATGTSQSCEIEINHNHLHDWLELRLFARPEGVAIQLRSTTQAKTRELRRDKQRRLLSRQVQERTAELAAVNRRLQDENDERLQAEATLTRTNQELAHALTALKQSQTRIMQSEKMASLGQLAAGVAHEINNPAGFISSNLHTLAEYHGDLQAFTSACGDLRGCLLQADVAAALPPKVQQKLAATVDLAETLDLAYIMEDMGALIAESREGTDRIRRIVDDLKTAIHPGDEIPTPTDLHAILDAAVNLIRHDTRDRIDIQQDYGALPALNAYPQRLHQVFLNLLVNAAQAIAGQGIITIRTCREDDQAVIRIEDSGSGIAADHLAKIFDPFFTTKPVGAGTGLGLKVVYDIVQNHGGTIAVENTRATGTTFAVRLPLTDDGKGNRPLATSNTAMKTVKIEDET